MLMALLPLAAFAEGFENATVQVGKFTYGGTAIPVVQVTDGGTILNTVDHYTVDPTPYKNTACTEPIAFNKMVVGTPYYVKITGNVGSVYETYQTYGTITVSRAPLTLTINGGVDLTKAYRAADKPASTLSKALADASQLKNGDDAADLNTIVTGTLSYTYEGQPNADVANDIPLTFSGLTAANYEISYSGLGIDITPKDLADVTITTQQGNVTYTGDVITPAYTLTDGSYTLVVGTGKDYTVACAEGDVKDVKTYTPTITGSNNYTGTITVGADALSTFKVTKATLSVAAKNIKRIYKAAAYTDADFVYEPVFYGLLGEDAAPLADYIAPTFALQGTAKDAGDYIIKVTGGSSKNYEFLAQNEGTLAGKLTIEPKEVTVTADDKTKGIGSAMPELTFTVTTADIFEADKATAITTNPTLACEATASSPAGTYPITISGGATSKNYKFKYVNGTLTVGKTAITLTILPATKVYGEDDPDWLGATGTPVKDVNYVVNGLQDGDELTNVHITRAEGKDFGKYVMTASYGAIDDTKYTGVSVAPAQFSITARPLTVTVLPQTLANNADASALVVSDETVVVEGLKFEDKVTDVVTLAFDASVGTKTDIDYAEGIVASLKTGVKNYSFDDVKGRVVFGAGSGSLVLDAADAATAATIELYNGQTKNVKIKFDRNGRTLGAARNWEKEYWVTLTLPFDIDVATLSQKLKYALVNEIDPNKTVIDGNGSKFYGKLTMKGSYGNATKLAANKPILVKIADNFADIIAGDGTIDFGSQKIIAPASEDALTVDAGKGAKFVGTYTAKTVKAEDNAAIWFMMGNYKEWAYILNTSANEWTIKPFEAFLDLNGLPASARDITFYFEELDGSTTAIKSISVDNLDSKLNVEGWYTLGGMKLQSAPTQKGIYINNGKKVVIK